MEVVFRQPAPPPGSYAILGASTEPLSCPLSALTRHFREGKLAQLAVEALQRAKSAGDAHPAKVEVELHYDHDALKLALHIYTTGSLRGAEIPKRATGILDKNWLKRGILDTYGIPLGIADLLERRPSAGYNTGGGVQRRPLLMDADLLRIYLESKAEPVVEEICSMMDLDLAATCDRTLFLVSSQAPKEPGVWGDMWSPIDSSEDEAVEYRAYGPDGPGAPSQLYVSRITGRGRPRRASRKEEAYGHCWVVNSEGTKHADLLAGRVSTGLLQAVAEGITRRHPHLQAYLYAYRVGASGEVSEFCGGKRSRQQRDAWGPQDDAQGQEADEEDEYVYEEGTVQLVCVSWSA
ncbi:hypothetical protein HYH03_012874 [Edaphochlamys debaryana]|uniref:Uncharacterized protein n=1 Tax=Edaphochlamys debaryana TaxID=47281 RepID=A0A835XXA5_9CHLO|nr:hypothetical protein HYH03_012874 [Edaphochlamys debaryana]|eukprot:KAG2488555.1 hypothetical protein HYH03_012874 [Edaphochlamys debaryana]